MNKDPNHLLSDSFSEQYGAAFKTIENVINKCSKELWEDHTHNPIISQVVHHVLFFVDYYLCKTKAERESFKSYYGEEIFGSGSEKIFSKEDLLKYLFDLRLKAKIRFVNLSLEELISQPIFNWHGSSVLSSIMYSLRHIMLHVGALHVRLDIAKIEGNWVSSAPIED